MNSQHVKYHFKYTVRIENSSQGRDTSSKYSPIRFHDQGKWNESITLSISLTARSFPICTNLTQFIFRHIDQDGRLSFKGNCVQSR